MEIKETAIRGTNCNYWQKGSHARHFQPSEEWPTETLIKLNENSGFSTYRFTINHSKSGKISILYIDHSRISVMTCHYVQPFYEIYKSKSVIYTNDV